MLERLRKRFGVEALWGVFAFVIVGLVVFWGSDHWYNNEGTFFEGFLVEASGFVLDIALFGVVMVALRPPRWALRDTHTRTLRQNAA